MHTYSLITGGSSGIGLETAKVLAKHGRAIALVARNAQKLAAAAEQVQAAGAPDVITIAADVQVAADIDHIFETLGDKPIDVLVNNAGLALGKSTLEDCDFADIQTMVDTNVVGFLNVAKQAIPLLRKTKGHIINISSIAGQEAYEGGVVYCATKAFVRMISKGLRIDLAGTEVRVTDIAPGKVETDFSTVRFKGDNNKAATEYQGYEPLQATDIAECIGFAVSRPAHVNIDHMLIMPTAQASATRLVKQ